MKYGLSNVASAVVDDVLKVNTERGSSPTIAAIVAGMMTFGARKFIYLRPSICDYIEAVFKATK